MFCRIFPGLGTFGGAGVEEPEVGGPRKGGRRQRLVCLDTVWCGAGGPLRRSKENPKPTCAGVSGLTNAASENVAPARACAVGCLVSAAVAGSSSSREPVPVYDS